MMDTVLKDFIAEGFVVVYMDDINIYSQSTAEHLLHLDKVFKRLSEVGIYCRPHKCTFMKSQIKFLGFIVGHGCRHVDPAVKQVVADWPVPTSKADVKSFLGFANFYREFIQDYSALATPLHNLTSDKVDFPVQLAADQLQAFISVRDALTSAPAMRLFDHNQPHVRVRLRTDASNFAIGAVLEQDFGSGFQPVAYRSKKLNGAQVNYSAYDRELLAIWDSCIAWRCYLLGRHF
jgi:hypothetical protein